MANRSTGVNEASASGIYRERTTLIAFWKAITELTSTGTGDKSVTAASATTQTPD
ncbi:hypothetical protein [Mycobacteroides abscessus]|uniref:hypothetical protein n=1 Tax=Mycobacteroides abscessus TaxID=36809 RepID=UPI0009CD614E|nr:hypothetical protein [Mycobacteroides abscessus]MBN7314151.1 hypothetical protein [Mycobacteroides abscessus subsp. abscessus]SKG09970.1 Uncharacterised protein [Mycobacteroides abscessus subsp. massiliense]